MTREELLKIVVKGDQSAFEFLSRVISAFHTWDDLIDRDHHVKDQDINQAFFTAFVWLPTNEFYSSNFSHLYPIIANSITNWMSANTMEREPQLPLDLEIAFITRSEYINLIIETARLCGGHEWAQSLTADIRRFSHSEGFEGYLKNLAIETEARNGAQSSI